MNKKELLHQYTGSEEKLLLSKVLDKLEQAENRNSISVTDFFDQYQQKVIEDVLGKIKANYQLYGGYEEASRKNVIFYPEEWLEEDVLKSYGDFIEMIRITLPKSLQGTYQHRDYLGGIMKLGLKREKIGDILCDDLGADVLVQKEISQYLLENLPYLTRFGKAKIEVMPLQELRKIEVQKKEINIISSSLRIDNVIAELLGISRTKANELLAQKRVFLNYQNETKNSKLIKEKDILVVRGKGKYEFHKITGNTKKNRLILTFLKYM